VEKTKSNTAKAHIHQSKEMYYNTKFKKKQKKLKPAFSYLLQHVAWKWSGSILKGKDM